MKTYNYTQIRKLLENVIKSPKILKTVAMLLIAITIKIIAVIYKIHKYSKSSGIRGSYPEIKPTKEDFLSEDPIAMLRNATTEFTYSELAATTCRDPSVSLHAIKAALKYKSSNYSPSGPTTLGVLKLIEDVITKDNAKCLSAFSKVFYEIGENISSSKKAIYDLKARIIHLSSETEVQKIKEEIKQAEKHQFKLEKDGLLLFTAIHLAETLVPSTANLRLPHVIDSLSSVLKSHRTYEQKLSEICDKFKD
ncbi:MAG: hypothetical protein KAH32_01605 [Chlamydiia bacterium]|nr:hypothetical protein [Chlamydiia bacterium]